VDINFPLNGWDTNHPRGQQPEGTSPDLLNVVPFDRDYRGRGAVRPGLSKYISTQMGNGGQPVLMVQQVTTALDPSTISVSTQLLSYLFTGANGTDVGALNSGNDWRTSSGGASFFPFTTVGTHKIDIKTNKAIAGSSAAGGAEASIYKPTLTLGSAYIIRMTVTFASTTGTNQVDDGYHITVRLNKSTFAQDGIAFVLYKNGVVLRDAAASNMNQSFSFGTAIVSGTYVMELHVNGNAFAGFVDGVQYVSGTTSYLSANSGIGFNIGKNLTAATVSEGITSYEVFAGSPLAAFRSTKVVAVCGGNVYVGDSTSLIVATSGTGVLSETIKPQMAVNNGICYLVDSQHNLKTLVMSTQTVADIVPTAGAETAITLGTYSLACTWHGRLVLAAPSGNAQNFIMSRQGTFTDFDYSQTDTGAAVAGNASKAGAIGEPLNCLMPWTDDVLILGGDHSIYKVEGDIAAGGQILQVSDSVGTLGADCWDTDPTGNLYFVGSGGLYRMTPGGPPQNIANDTVKKFFADINRVTTYVVCTWDRDRNGLHIHATPVNSGAATHLFYDATTNGFFPLSYPNTVGPITSVVFDGDGPADRQLLLAGRDGYIRKNDTTAVTDDGTAITNYVYIGPFRPAGDAALSVLEAMEVMLGDAPTGFTETDFQVTLSVVVAKDVYTALVSPDKTVNFTFTKQSRRKRLLQRISGGTFFFKLTGVASKLWSLEKIVALFTEGGLQRRY
jgi:hypothetical protein